MRGHARITTAYASADSSTMSWFRRHMLTFIVGLCVGAMLVMMYDNLSYLNLVLEGGGTAGGAAGGGGGASTAGGAAVTAAGSSAGSVAKVKVPMENFPEPAWRPPSLIAATTVTSTPFARFEVHKVRTENGAIVEDWLWTDERAHVNILVHMADSNKYLLFHQMKYGLATPKYAAVGGLFNVGETPLECAHRELLEETGLVAGQMVYLGGYRVQVNRGGGILHAFLARNSVPKVRVQTVSGEMLQQESAGAGAKAAATVSLPAGGGNLRSSSGSGSIGAGASMAQDGRTDGKSAAGGASADTNGNSNSNSNNNGSTGGVGVVLQPDMLEQDYETQHVKLLSREELLRVVLRDQEVGEAQWLAAIATGLLYEEHRDRLLL